MEERDFIKKEIEKIARIARAVRQILFGGKDQIAVTTGSEVQMSKNMLAKEMGFDVNRFLLMGDAESVEYLQSFEGLDFHNMESLADILAEMGYRDDSPDSKDYLGKALFVYDLITKRSHTYSFEREDKIAKIKAEL
ncbi:MAG: hypothetical protein Q3998_05470 [Porphyromonas sp.]|nr:hypothetical protein [Porphyromonas sp.]